MVVAQIAYNHLDSAVKAKCDALVAVPLSYGGASTSNFVTAAVWADDYKSQLGSSIWHCIDLPFSLDGTSTNGFVPASFDVVQAINLSIATLQNSSASQSNQAVSLRYLLHFVGDIQQPLHASDAFFASQPNGDAGANSFGITGTWNNLHSVWDSGGSYLTDSLSRPLSAAGQTTLSNKVAAIEADYPVLSENSCIPIRIRVSLCSKASSTEIASENIARGPFHCDTTISRTESLHWDNSGSWLPKRMGSNWHSLRATILGWGIGLTTLSSHRFCLAGTLKYILRNGLI